PPFPYPTRCRSEKLTGAVEQLVTGEDWTDALRFAARFRSRSFNNVLLIWEQHQAAFEQSRVPEPFPTYVAGYKQWQQLGRQVEKRSEERRVGEEGRAGGRAEE